MHCASCGEEIAEESKYCKYCGEIISKGDEKEDSETIEGKDYDFIMGIEDGFRRTKSARLLLDAVLLLVSAGFWFGLLVVEYISHYYKIKTGERKTHSEGDEEVWHIF